MWSSPEELLNILVTNFELLLKAESWMLIRLDRRIHFISELDIHYIYWNIRQRRYMCILYSSLSTTFKTIAFYLKFFRVLQGRSFKSNLWLWRSRCSLRLNFEMFVCWLRFCLCKRHSWGCLNIKNLIIIGVNLKNFYLRKRKWHRRLFITIRYLFSNYIKSSIRHSCWRRSMLLKSSYGFLSLILLNFNHFYVINDGFEWLRSKYFCTMWIVPAPIRFLPFNFGKFFSYRISCDHWATPGISNTIISSADDTLRMRERL